MNKMTMILILKRKNCPILNNEYEERIPFVLDLKVTKGRLLTRWLHNSFYITYKTLEQWLETKLHRPNLAHYLIFLKIKF